MVLGANDSEAKWRELDEKVMNTAWPLDMCTA